MSPAPYLEAYRRKHGMNYIQLAEFIDYDPGNLCRLFQQATYDLRVTTAYKIAQRLGTTIEVLMGVADEETPEGARQSH